MTNSKTGEQFTIINDQDCNSYVVPEKHYEALCKYFDEFYRLAESSSSEDNEKAYELVAPCDYESNKIEGERIIFKDWELR